MIDFILTIVDSIKLRGDSNYILIPRNKLRTVDYSKTYKITLTFEEVR